MLCNRSSTVSGSDSRFFHLPTPPISSTKSFKFCSIRLPSRSSSFKLKVACVAEPPSSSSSGGGDLSFYKLLGVPETGSLSDIKQAYKKLARKYHPDVSPPGQVDEHTKMFIQIHEAYETLSDSTRRTLYDISVGLRSDESYDHVMVELKKEWRARWMAQLEELKKRATNEKYGDRSHLWAARVHRQGNESLNKSYQMAEVEKEWRAQREAQLAGLQNRTTNKKYGDRSQLWAARVRRARNESVNEF